MRSRAVTWLARGLINLPGGSADSCNLGLHGLASATTWRTSNLNDIGTQHMGQPMQLLWHSTAAAEARSSSQSAHHKGQEQRAAQTSAAKGFVRGGFSVDMFPPERIRNFCIVAHIDHGKSTLADRLMEMTGAFAPGQAHQAQYLDKLQVERDRGITVKAQTVSLVYQYKSQDYLINLIDTPGHVDFTYEVSRSLAACQGALLLVDAGQGVQAQTVANWRLAVDQGLAVVPALNKCDLPQADPESVTQQLQDVCGVSPDEQVLRMSAKTGQGCGAVLHAIIERVPSPTGDPGGPCRLLLFDAFHDQFRGVVALVEVVDGFIKEGMTVASAATGSAWEVLEVGVLAPDRHRTGRLLTGQVGYVITGMKELHMARVGDTWHELDRPVTPLPGFKPARSMVYAGLYPINADDFEALSVAMERLTLNDASVVVKRENSDALGAGFRCGFLGMLHMEVFMQRLDQEHGVPVVTTTPTVPYLLDMGPLEEPLEISRASDFPTDKKVNGILEPTVLATIITPSTYVGKVMELCMERRGEMLEHTVLANTSAGRTSSTGNSSSTGADSSSSGGGHLSSDTSSSHSAATSSIDTAGRSSSGGGSPHDERGPRIQASHESASTGGRGGGDAGAQGFTLPLTSPAEGMREGGVQQGGGRVLLRYVLPLSELASNFFSELKSRTQGYATLDYEEGEYRPADLQRLDIYAHGKPVDALARLVHRNDIVAVGRALIGKMKSLLDRQQFEVVLQAVVNGRVVARETLKALRKDVTSKCYGGDISRKRKLLEKQKEGKKRLKRLGSIDVPASAFPELMRTR